MARKKNTIGTVAPDYDAQKRFQRRRAWFSMEWQRQEANRCQQALDEDYYDSLQWTEEEAAAVRARGQNPVVFNEVKPTIDWLIGTERRMRRDFKVLARNNAAKEAAQDAEVKTKLLKYLADVNRVPFERSRAFDDAVKAGLGLAAMHRHIVGQDHGLVEVLPDLPGATMQRYIVFPEQLAHSKRVRVFREFVEKIASDEPDTL